MASNEPARVVISFIIPAYNSEKVLKRAVETVVNDCTTTDIDYEVIIVENGSSDDTFIKANELAHNNTKIRVFQSEKGVSRARNKGIEESKGEIIIFVDSDDLWINGSINRIIQDWKETQADLFQYAYMKGNKTVMHKFDKMDVLLSGQMYEYAREWMISRPTLRMQVWGKTFSGKLIRESGVRFDEKLNYSEDGDFIIRLTAFASKMIISNKRIYQYCEDTQSTMRSFDNRKTKGYIDSMLKTKEFILKESDAIKIAFNEYILIHLNVVLVNEVFSILSNSSFVNRIRRMNTLLKIPLFKEAIQSVSYRSMLTTQLLPELFFKTHLSVMGGVICYVKAWINFRRYKQLPTCIGDSSCL